jgi:hypothetical protein
MRRRAAQERSVVTERELRFSRSDRAFYQKVLIGADKEQMLHAIAADQQKAAALVNVIELADGEALTPPAANGSTPRPDDQENYEKHQQKHNRRAGIDAEILDFHQWPHCPVPSLSSAECSRVATRKQ